MNFFQRVINKGKNKEETTEPTLDQQIVFYGASWCPASRRARAILDENKIPYHWIDIDQDAEAAALVKELNHGFRSVPTIIFPDGSHLTEPSDATLEKKLGI